MECTICAHLFGRERIPLNLPCGHTFCQVCIKALKGMKSLLCPTCKASHAEISIVELKPNKEMESLVEEEKESDTKSEVGFTNEEVGDICGTHKSPLRYWCKTCRLIICADCIILSHGPSRHKVLTSSESLVHLQSECKAKVRLDREKLSKINGEAKEAIIAGEMMVKKLKETMAEMDEYAATLKEHESKIISSSEAVLSQMLNVMNRKEPIDLLVATEEIPRFLRKNLYLNKVFRNWIFQIERLQKNHGHEIRVVFIVIVGVFTFLFYCL
ncbi:tripartite motif-containing protein 5-like isoform X2 [Oratosquilla oratoria]